MTGPSAAPSAAPPVGPAVPASPAAGTVSIFTPEYVRALVAAFRRIFPLMGAAEAVRAALEWQAHPLDARLNAAFAAVFVLGALGLRLSRQPLRVIRLAFLGAVTVSLGFSLWGYALLPLGLAAGDAAYALTGHYMYLLYVMMLLCWLLFPVPLASRLALGLYGSSLGLGLLSSAAALTRGQVSLSGVLNFLLHQAIVGGSFYVLLGVFTAVYARQARLEGERVRLRRDALLDPLTGLANRRAFDTALGQQVAAAHATGQPLSLVTLDLDHFKAVNDTHGHDTGDRVLLELAGLLRRHTRAGDQPARWGGEEFAWVLPGAGAPTAAQTAERLRATVAAWPFVCGPLTVSLGTATLRPGEDGQALFRRADAALYRAKREGRDRVCAAGDAPSEPETGPESGAAAAPGDQPGTRPGIQTTLLPAR